MSTVRCLRKLGLVADASDGGIWGAVTRGTGVQDQPQLHSQVRPGGQPELREILPQINMLGKDLGWVVKYVKIL